eukprot:gb/GECG01010749.1/.p1 GENE.gb/GECG01010749.1/~~gb/GECG01010749.1/.p1  ORF type:complete len:116 (+),score=8.41 gb/GECG01010749.1/:1-348(+)
MHAYSSTNVFPLARNHPGRLTRQEAYKFIYDTRIRFFHRFRIHPHECASFECPFCLASSYVTPQNHEQTLKHSSILFEESQSDAYKLNREGEYSALCFSLCHSVELYPPLPAGVT